MSDRVFDELLWGKGAHAVIRRCLGAWPPRSGGDTW